MNTTADATAARRAFVLVIDACGVGALPDAGEYGDEGANTLAHVAERCGGLALPTMASLGLGCIARVEGVAPAAEPRAVHGRLHPLGPGKDSVNGHWELMGVVLERPLPTYPHGFPPEVVARLEDVSGHQMLCNRPHNGLAAIEEFGAEQLRSGGLILYTSQDSVLQLAAHVDRLPADELYDACAAVREAMSAEHAVGRVIARPFTGAEGKFRRTEGRRDYALAPPARSYLQELEDARVPVHAVGKVADLFAGVGIGERHPGANNAQALDSVAHLQRDLDEGFVFANLIETDQVYGHRKDAAGFAGALTEIDAALAALVSELRAGDLLVVTADHGVDPSHPGTDHTREHVPLLALTGAMAREAARGERHDGVFADVGATVLAWLTRGGGARLPGRAFIS
jgi:phosphopentomutase